ncbi:hypothetical protein Patl1_16508 [Pistacia atlantica]|uniref:Uncharacterized protein n=1 Tax=Pistacia atlantica TaxID=434234 RepID=A0ACC1B9N1_9ROSI|nr:hypothetical protein Patl1_16508 [Pistacia atlantica]
MLIQRRVMSWRRVFKSLQALTAHALLFCFTLLLVLKLDHILPYSWWITFSPLWLFHIIVARGRFSLPAPSTPHDRHWAPYHAVMATPLLVAFELLLCIHLESSYVVNLKIVFVPLLAFETAILVDNIRYIIFKPRTTFLYFYFSFFFILTKSKPGLDLFNNSSLALVTKYLFYYRMCRALMPGDEESLSDEAIWETLPHFWVAISMIFFLAATIFTLLKLCGDVAALVLQSALLFLFAQGGTIRQFTGTLPLENPSLSSLSITYFDHNRGLVVSADDDRHQSSRICKLQDIGGHIMKIPFICFQILLFMHLEATPSGARQISFRVIFAPLFLIQGAGVLYAAYRVIEKIALLLCGRDAFGRCLTFVSKGSRLLGVLASWLKVMVYYNVTQNFNGLRSLLDREGTTVRHFLMSIACGSFLFTGCWVGGQLMKEAEKNRLDSIVPRLLGLFHILHFRTLINNVSMYYYAVIERYNTFSPDVVKKMPKKELVEEIWRLQGALSEQTEITKFSQQEYERLQNEKILCRVCFEEQISIVLLPCRHHILCSTCSEKCKKCPICRVFIEGKTVYIRCLASTYVRKLQN